MRPRAGLDEDHAIGLLRTIGELSNDKADLEMQLRASVTAAQWLVAQRDAMLREAGIDPPVGG